MLWNSFTYFKANKLYWLTLSKSIFLLENRMSSCGIFRKLSWKFSCVLISFLVLLQNRCVLIKELCLLIENSCFLIKLLHPSLLAPIWCAQKISLKKVAPGTLKKLNTSPTAPITFRQFCPWGKFCFFVRVS